MSKRQGLHMLEYEVGVIAIRLGCEATVQNIRQEIAHARKCKQLAPGSIQTTFHRLVRKGYARIEQLPLEPGKGGRPENRLVIRKAGVAELSKKWKTLVYLTVGKVAAKQSGTVARWID